MHRFATSFACASLASLASAQFTVVVPNGTTAAEGASSTAYPWGRGTSQIRVQYVFDSTHFTNQGVTTPIIVNNLRFRANGAAVTAGYTYGNATVQMSTAAVDYLAPSSTFASNHGPNVATVYTGPVTVATPAGTTPNTWYVNIPIAPFAYDPTLGGDLCLDMSHDGIGAVSTAGPAHDCMTTGALTSRISNLTNYLSPTGTTQQNVGIVVELGYAPANGLFPAFTGTPLTGPLGTVVQFTNQSFSSAPGGVTSWAWDFNGDAIVDSNLPNPSFQYNTGGVYNVSLTVGDGVNPQQTLTKNAYVGIDLADASFTSSVVSGTLVQFTDTSLGNPTSWAWDFENDGIVDSNLQNPAHVYPSAGAYNCKLTAANGYSTDSVTVNLGIGIIPMPAFGSTFTGAAATRGFWFQSPTRFSIVSALVPDESNFGQQNVALYRLAAAPPVFSASTTGGLEFVSTLQSSNAAIPCAVSFDTGEFVGVLGACGDASTCRNSYGTPAGPYASSVLGSAVTLTRFITQTNLAVTNGTAAYSQEPTGAISRVILGVSAAVGLQYGTGSPSPYAPAPTLKTTQLPIIGQSAQLTYTNNDALALGLVVAGIGRANVPTPFGTLLIGSIDFVDTLNGGAPIAPGSYTYSFAIPNNPSLQGVGPVNWQGANIVLPNGEFALSNATEWWLAQ